MNDKQYTALLMTLGRKLTDRQLSIKEYEERLATVTLAYNTARQAVAENYKKASDAVTN